MAIAVGDDAIESLWMRIKETDIKGTVVGVYYRPPTQDNGTDELLYRQFEEISGSVTLILMGHSNFLGIYWLYHTTTASKSGKFLKHLEGNFLPQVLRLPTQKIALLDLFEIRDLLIYKLAVD